MCVVTVCVCVEGGGEGWYGMGGERGKGKEREQRAGR